MKDLRTTARTLGLAGLIPFAALVFIAGWGAPDWVIRLLVAYAVLILAFMAGTLWALAIQREGIDARALVVGNILALAGWPAVVMPFGWALVWLALGFGIQAWSEMLWTGGQYPPWYRHLRWLLSAAVIGLLVLAAVVYWSSG